MIIDITGIELTPGNFGENCLGNGVNADTECCCDECNYLICCTDEKYQLRCYDCDETDCENRIQKH